MHFLSIKLLNADRHTFDKLIQLSSIYKECFKSTLDVIDIKGIDYTRNTNYKEIDF